MILLSDTAMILYNTGSSTSIQGIHIIFTLSGGTYTIDDFNAKVKVTILQQRQHWEASQIKDLQLFIPKHYAFMVSNNFLIKHFKLFQNIL